MDKTPTVQNTKYGSPAFRAGLYPGDRLLELDGKRVESIEHLKRMVQSLESLEVPITYQRGEHTFTTPLKLEADKKIGASFTEGINDVTEVWVKDSLKSAKKPAKEKSSDNINPYPKSSSWVSLFQNLGWLSLAALTLSLLARVFTEISINSGLPVVFAFFFLINKFFAQQLQISMDTRWQLGETHKLLKDSQKTN